MNLVCALFGHQPTPFGVKRFQGTWVSQCLLCQKPLDYRKWRWELAEDFPEPDSDEREVNGR